MIKTGHYNSITGEEITKIEESDITFWDIDWDDLTRDQQAMFCSFCGFTYLALVGQWANGHIIKDRYEYFQLKNTMEL